MNIKPRCEEKWYPENKLLRTQENSVDQWCSTAISTTWGRQLQPRSPQITGLGWKKQYFGKLQIFDGENHGLNLWFTLDFPSKSRDQQLASLPLSQPRWPWHCSWRLSCIKLGCHLARIILILWWPDLRKTGNPQTGWLQKDWWNNAWINPVKPPVLVKLPQEFETYEPGWN